MFLLRIPACSLVEKGKRNKRASLIQRTWISARPITYKKNTAFLRGKYEKTTDKKQKQKIRYKYKIATIIVQLHQVIDFYV